MSTADKETSWIESEANSTATTLTSAAIHAGRISWAEVPAFFQSAYTAASNAMKGVQAGGEPEAVQVEKPSATQIRKSVTPDGLISFIDGKAYKTLKRHLRTHGLSPEAYRERYGLPADYPLVSASYSAQRSALAKQLGLGQPASRKAEEAAA